MVDDQGMQSTTQERTPKVKDTKQIAGISHHAVLVQEVQALKQVKF